jgi:O-Antigen ligase
VSPWAVRVATLATRGAAVLVLLLYAPAFDAPFLVPKFAALEITAALGFVAFGLERAAAGRLRWSPGVSLGVTLVLATTCVSWAMAASVGVAPYGAPAVARWISLLGLACGASVLSDDPDARQALLSAITAAAVAVASIGLLQHVELLPFYIPVISMPGSTFGNRNLAAEAIAMALPLGVAAAAGARGRGARVAIVAALAIQVVYLAVTRARGAWVGAACGLVAVAWLARVRWSRRTVALAAGLAIAAAVAAAIPGRFNPRDAGDTKRYSDVVQVLEGGVDVHSTAIRTRVGLWRRTLAMIADHPWFGVGPGNWPVFFPLYAEPDATADGVMSVAVEPRQAHDDVLERMAETGVIGLAALLVLALAVVRSGRQQLAIGARRVSAAGAAGALVGLVVLAVPAFPLEMPATIALAGLSLGLLVPADGLAGGVSAAENAPLPGSIVAMPTIRAFSLPSLAGYAALAGGTAFALLAALRANATARESWWLGVSERAFAHEPGPVGDAQGFEALKRALKERPRDRRALMGTAKVELRLGDPANAFRAAQRVLEIEPYAPNAWALLSAAELATGEVDAARRDASRAITLLNDCPLALQTRATAEARAGDLTSAAADQDRLNALAAGAETDGTARAARALLMPPR